MVEKTENCLGNLPLFMNHSKQTVDNRTVFSWSQVCVFLNHLFKFQETKIQSKKVEMSSPGEL